MSQKNYYQLLQISPQATAQEIKAAYRKLAFKYHPDRNKGNILTEAVFKDIYEAYSILSHPEKRKFYNASIAVNTYYSKHKRPAPVTSHTILQDAVKLKTVVEKHSILSINQDIVFHKIQALLSDYHLHILLLDNNRLVLQQFIQQILSCMRPLAFTAVQPLLAPLKKLAASNETMLHEINSFYHHKKSEAFWQRNKLFIVIVLAMLLCLLIYFFNFQ